MLKSAFFLLLVKLLYANGALLLWSNRKLDVRPLDEFRDDEFNVLTEKLKQPVLHVFKTAVLNPDIKDVISGFYTAYTPNGLINTDNATELEGGSLDRSIILEKMSQHKDPTIPVLYALVIESNEIRYKRDVGTTKTDDDDEPTDSEVFYLGKSTKDDIYGLLYSTKNLLLNMNNTNISLGSTSTDMITVDKGVRDDILRFTLNINIPLEGGKVSLRFIFFWLKVIGYWSFHAVIVTDTRTSISSNLTCTEEILIPPGFSYHCPGKTLFINRNDSVSLLINDMQVEVDSKDKKFSDAWDCITFTTVPIWSGLFVTSIFILAIFFGFAAIGDIKTMDKFDNYKTKQLHITTFE